MELDCRPVEGTSFGSMSSKDKGWSSWLVGQSFEDLSHRTLDEAPA